MTRECAIRMLMAKLKCMELETSGTTPTCNNRDCDACRLNYEQGNMGEQKECLRLAIKALQADIAMDFITLCDKLSHETEEQQQIIDDLQKENKRLHQVFDIKDAERAKLVKENKELQNENLCLREIIRIKDNERVNLVNENNYISAELTSVKNDYKQSVNEIALLNRQLDRQNTAVNDLSDIVDTSHKVIDDLKKENAKLKFRLKMLKNVYLNGIYGSCVTTYYTDTDSIKETKDNDSNN